MWRTRNHSCVCVCACVRLDFAGVCEGFIGRYVVNRLGKMGCRVVVPYRGDELHVRHLKPMGDLGVINPMAMSIRNLDEIETAVAGSNVVINLLGKHFETRRAPA